MASLSLAFDILARDRASREFRDVGNAADDAGRKGSRFGGAMASAAKLAAGAFAAAQLGSFLKDAVAEAREAQKVGALTESIIKSTGGAAKISADQVGALATSISNKTGIDDEAIQTGSNLLLTFKNVRNEAGKGAKIFDRATQAAVDLSAAGFGSVDGASKMLGKALNDPIKGISALGRAGVTFTDQQKEQIKTLVKSGDTLAAQKIILGEVESQVGGAAAASATAGEKLSVSFGNFKEAIGTALLPILDKAMTATAGFIATLSENLGPTLSRVGEFLKPAIDAFKVFLEAISGGEVTTLGPLGKVGDAAYSIRDAFTTLWQQAGPAIGQLIAFIKTQFVPAVMGVVTAFKGYLAVIIPIIQQFVQGMLTRIQPMLPTIKNVFSQIGGVITDVMGLIQAVISRVTTVVSFIWRNWGSGIMDFVTMVFGNLLTIIGGALDVIRGIIKTVTSLIKGDWSGAWEGIKQIVSGALGIVKGIVKQSIDVVRTILSVAWSFIKSGASQAWESFKGIISRSITSAVGFIRGLPGKAAEALGNLGDTLYRKGQSLIQGLIDGIRNKIADVGKAAGEIADKIKGFFPGSPVKEGPLVAWNNGGAGRRLGGMLANGLIDSRSLVASASNALAASVGSPTATVGVGTSGRGPAFGATPGSGSAFQRLHPHDIAAIVDGFAKARPTAVLSASAVDSALAVGL